MLELFKITQPLGKQTQAIGIKVSQYQEKYLNTQLAQKFFQLIKFQ